MICNLSALANNCEYLNYDKTCTVFSGTSKANANRQLNCKNEQKTVCCYLCIFRSQCPINCKYLGQTENYTESQQPEPKNVSMPSVSGADDDKTLKDKPLTLESIPVAFCFSCNIEMAWTKTQFTIDLWHGNKPLLFNNENVLPVTVLLCPKCGKIEFKANLTTKEGKVHNGSS